MPDDPDYCGAPSGVAACLLAMLILVISIAFII
jgi:hypothetical protein